MSDQIPTHDSEGRPIRGWAVEGQDPESVPAYIKEAVEEVFDGVDELPYKATVVGYVPLDLPSAEWIADQMIQHIDETLGEYGDPEADEVQVSDEAVEAISDAARMVRDTYPVYCLQPSDVRLTVCPRDYFSEG